MPTPVVLDGEQLQQLLDALRLIAEWSRALFGLGLALLFCCAARLWRGA